MIGGGGCGHKGENNYLHGKIPLRPQEIRSQKKISMIIEPPALMTSPHLFLSWGTLEVVCL